MVDLPEYVGPEWTGTLKIQAEQDFERNVRGTLKSLTSLHEKLFSGNIKQKEVLTLINLIGDIDAHWFTILPGEKKSLVETCRERGWVTPENEPGPLIDAIKKELAEMVCAGCKRKKE